MIGALHSDRVVSGGCPICSASERYARLNAGETMFRFTVPACVDVLAAAGENYLSS